MIDDSRYPRDLVGYGRDRPDPAWPGRARLALQFVLNYEEGGENCILHGDPGSEQFLSELFDPPAFSDRHLSMESVYEYGSRVGVWRILREFERRGLPLTVFLMTGYFKALPREVLEAAVVDGDSAGDLLHRAQECRPMQRPRFASTWNG